MKKILEAYADEETRAEEGLKDYESPAWPYLQANRNGAKRALTKVASLFKEQVSV